MSHCSVDQAALWTNWVGPAHFKHTVHAPADIPGVILPVLVGALWRGVVGSIHTQHDVLHRIGLDDVRGWSAQQGVAA